MTKELTENQGKYIWKRPGIYKVLELADDNFKNIPIIILSNLGQDSDIEKGKLQGATDYLVKANFSMKEVIEKVKFHLAKSKRKKT